MENCIAAGKHLEKNAENVCRMRPALRIGNGPPWCLRSLAMGAVAQTTPRSTRRRLGDQPVRPNGGARSIPSQRTQAYTKTSVIGCAQRARRSSHCGAAQHRRGRAAGCVRAGRASATKAANALCTATIEPRSTCSAAQHGSDGMPRRRRSAAASPHLRRAGHRAGVERHLRQSGMSRAGDGNVNTSVMDAGAPVWRIICTAKARVVPQALSTASVELPRRAEQGGDRISSQRRARRLCQKLLRQIVGRPPRPAHR